MHDWIAEQRWEADCFRVHTTNGTEGLERRLSTLGGPSRRSGRGFQVWAGVLLATLAPALLVPWRLSAAAAEAPAADTLAQRWEDLLLLEAMRYLELSPAQVKRLQPLALTAEEHLDRAAEQEAAILKPLAQIAARQREALLSGTPISLEEQARALQLEKELAPLRRKATEELTNRVAPSLGRLLSASQVERAFLLSHGEMPRGLARRPALLDPASGFVLDPRAKEESRRTATRRVLARTYDPDLAQLAADSSPGWSGQWAELLKTPEHGGSGTQDPCASCHAATENASRSGTPGAYFRLFGLRNGRQRPDASLLAAAERARQRLDELPVLARALTMDGPDAERSEAVKGLTRRLFSSPRLQTVIEERLRHGGSLPDAPIPQEGDR